MSNDIVAYNAQHILSALGQNIVEKRKTLGFIQQYVAEHAGLSRSYYGHLERGNKNISILNLMKIALILRVNPSSLFSGLEIEV